MSHFSVFFRAFLKSPARSLGLMLSIGFGIGIWGALDLAFKSIPHTLDQVYEKTHFSDLEVQFLADDKYNLPDLMQVEGVQAVEHRLLLPGTILRDGQPPLTSLLVLTDGPQVKVDDLMLTAGKPFAPKSSEVVIERSLREYHNYGVGNRIRFKVGEKVIDATVSGVAISPEFFSMSSNPDFSIPEKGTLGVGFGDLSVFNAALGFTLVNDLVLTFKPGVSSDAVRQSVLSLLQGLTIDKVMTRDDQFSHQQIMFNLSGYKSNGWAMVVALVLLSIFICFLTYSRVVIELRKAIGNLSALGYSSRRILGAWLTASLLLGLGGGLVASIIALLQRMAIAESFGAILGLPFIHYFIAGSTIAICMSISVLISLAASALPMILLLRETPRAILTPNINVSHYPPFVLRATDAVLEFLSVQSRFGVRNLFRRPGLAVSSVLLIGFAVSVAVAYALCTTSYNKSMFAGLEQERWDDVVDFTHPVFKEDAEKLALGAPVTALVPYFRGFVEAEANGKSIDTRILGIQPSSGMRDTNVIAGAPLRDQDLDGAIIAKDIARDLSLSVGDTLRTHYQDLSFPLKVIGISGDLNLRQLTMNYATAQKICGFSERATGVYVKTIGGQPLPAPKGDFVAKVTSFQQMHTSLSKVWDDALVMVYVATGFCNAMVIIFLVMFIMLTVSERQVEYATLRASGYDRSSILRIVLAETLTQVGIAVILSIPMAVALTVLLNYRLSQSFFKVQFFWQWIDLVQAPAIAVAIATGVAVLSARSVTKKEIAPQLRSREIG